MILKITFSKEKNRFKVIPSESDTDPGLSRVPFRGKSISVNRLCSAINAEKVVDFDDLGMLRLQFFYLSDIKLVQEMSQYVWCTLDEQADAALKLMTEKEQGSSRVESSIDVPENRSGKKPYVYQLAGVEGILKRWNMRSQDDSRMGVLMADEMGLGKTIMTACALLMQKEIRRTLILCPSMVMTQYREELLEWLNTGDPRFCVPSNQTPWGYTIDSTGIQLMETTRESPHGRIVVTNYEKLQREPSRSAIIKQQWDCVVVDEAHNFKNEEAIRTEALMMIKAKFRMMTTGTPVPNRLEDVYSLLNWLQPGLVGDYFDFKSQYADNPVSGAISLNKLLRSTIMIRRTRDQVFKELPKSLEFTTLLEPTPNVITNEGMLNRMLNTSSVDSIQARLLKKKGEAEKPGLSEYARESIRQEMEELIKKLYTAMKIDGYSFEEISAIRRETSVEKIPFVIERAEEILKEEESMIIAFIHRDVGNRLKKHFGKRCSVVMGGMSRSAANSQVVRFRSGASQVLLLSIDAAKEGLNLQSTSYMLVAELPWNDSRFSQLKGRILRPGQTRDCRYEIMLFKDSIDEKVAATMVIKKQLHEALTR